MILHNFAPVNPTDINMCKHCDCNNHIHDSEHHHQQGHEHEHHHEHHGEMKESIIKISVATALLITAVVVDNNIEMLMWQRLVVYFVPYLIVGFGTIREALEGIAHGNIFNEHFLMTIATAGALAIGFMPNGEPEFTEAVFVMLFFQVGELFEGYAEGQSRKSIAHLMNIRPDTANVERDGEVLIVSPEEVEIGETIVVKPGERIPLDGIVVEGSSSLDTSALTGESVPREVTADDEVISGCISLTGVLHIRAIRPYGESTVSKILELMESAGESKSHSETFIARFARVYTPVVVLLAFVIAFVPPLFYDSYSTAFTDWLYKALTFLIVSCPCALVISVPLTFFGGMGGASRKGSKLYGHSCQSVNGGVRQDRHPHPRTFHRYCRTSRRHRRDTSVTPRSPCRAFHHPSHWSSAEGCIPDGGNRRMLYNRHRRDCRSGRSRECHAGR